MKNKHYRLAVDGKANSTAVGRSYDSISEALGDSDRVNAQRAKDGQKPVTSLKVSTPRGTYRHVRYVVDDDDDE